ncbi:sigma factor G inhibitor Gin [Syntrophomonas palmitatica]|uniref:sigma factor G inhibitor Gin n=1 Tax=Syntrophomonas palmitatica TaxID=402877 RepID=UPI0006D2C5DE|nr:sigma factor G inhibitor Gin [Syntrophomonas palmitatica]
MTKLMETKKLPEKFGMLVPRCAICEKVPQGGIREGIKIRRGFICTNCERMIIGVDAGSNEYNQILLKLRTLIKKAF